ncbi:MAG: VOC family protein [Chloroflexota bacterium]
MSAIFWFEIPVLDINRAQQFYSTVLNSEIPLLDMTEQMGSMLGVLPDNGGVGGMLVQNSQFGYEPSTTGTLVYLALGDTDLNDTLAKIESAGGKVLMPKADMGERGFSAWIEDSEGNKVGLHSYK